MLLGMRTGGGLRPKVKADFLTSASIPSWLTFSRAGGAMQYDSTGKLTWAPENILLNTATLSTQNVTTVSTAPYILSFYGTGTVTLSGTSTAGPLVGTGVGDRVYLKFTPTAGTLTLTVSGSVTSAQLERVTYQTTPRTYLPTTSAAVYGPRFDYDPSTLAARGLLLEEARTNVCLQSSTEAWTFANKTTGFVSPTGETNAIRVLSGVGSTGSAAQTWTSSSTRYSYSLYVKYYDSPTLLFGIYDSTSGGFGAGNGSQCTITWSAGVPTPTRSSGTGTAAAVSVGNGWYRITVADVTTVSGNSHLLFIYPESGSGPACTGKGNYIFGAQVEAAVFATSYIPTAAAAVTRVTDALQVVGAGFAPLTAGAGAFVGQIQVVGSSAGTGRIFSSDNGARAYISEGTTTTVDWWNGTSVVATGSGNNYVSAPQRVVAAWNDAAPVRRIGLTGTTIVESATDPTTNDALSAWIGSVAGIVSFSSMWLQGAAIYNKTLTAAQLTKKLTVNGSY